MGWGVPTPVEEERFSQAIGRTENRVELWQLKGKEGALSYIFQG